MQRSALSTRQWVGLVVVLGWSTRSPSRLGPLSISDTQTVRWFGVQSTRPMREVAVRPDATKVQLGDLIFVHSVGQLHEARSEHVPSEPCNYMSRAACLKAEALLKEPAHTKASTVQSLPVCFLLRKRSTLA